MFFKYANYIELLQAKKFHSFIINYCEKNNLNGFKEFLYYGWNGISSKTMYYLIGASKIYLASSKSFLQFHHNLDEDFKYDIITDKEISDYYSKVLVNPKLYKKLQQIMKEDFRENT